MSSNNNRLNLEALSKEGKGQLLNQNTYKPTKTIYEELYSYALNLYDFFSSPASFIIDGLGIIGTSILSAQPPPFTQVALLGFGCAKTVWDNLKETEVRCEERFKQACEKLPTKEPNNPVNKKGIL